MKIVLNTNEDLEVTELDQPEMQIEPRADDAHFSALQMFATGFAMCTASVLMAYAEQIEVGAAGMSVRMRWDYAEKPFRIRAITMDIDWPDLPESRQQAAQRAAGQCTLHNTLEQPPTVTTRVNP